MSNKEKYVQLFKKIFKERGENLYHNFECTEDKCIEAQKVAKEQYNQEIEFFDKNISYKIREQCALQPWLRPHCILEMSRRFLKEET